MGEHLSKVISRKIKNNEELTLFEFLLTKTWASTWKDFQSWVPLNVVDKPRRYYQWDGLFDAFSREYSREALTTPGDVRDKIRLLGVSVMSAADAHMASASFDKLSTCAAKLKAILAELDRIRSGRG